MNVLSLFDGISGAQLALKKSKIKVDNYYASEIDGPAMTITQYRFPNTIQLGDVTNINAKKLPKIDIIFAGSPCQDLSNAGRRKGMSTQDVEITSYKQYMRLKKLNTKFEGQSYLFWEFIRLYNELKPTYFFLENVRMTDKWKQIISKELNCEPILINSSSLSAQNRERYYWSNFPNISAPKNKSILLFNVIPDAVSGYGIRGTNKGNVKSDGSILWEMNGTVRKDFKANCITTAKTNTSKVLLCNGKIRDLTVDEAETLQTLPKNYTKVPGINKKQRWHGIGNGWTITVVSHLMKGLKKHLVK